MKLEQLKEVWSKDCDIDHTQLDMAALNVPKLHAKYIQQLMDHKMKLVSLKIRRDELIKAKYRYYRGEMSLEDLNDHGWAQYQGTKPSSAGMDKLIEGDSEVNELSARIEYINNMIYFYESIMGQIRDMGFSIKNSIEFKKFLAGS